jgi:hypothetical protein
MLWIDRGETGPLPLDPLPRVVAGKKPRLVLEDLE